MVKGCKLSVTGKHFFPLLFLFPLITLLLFFHLLAPSSSFFSIQLVFLCKFFLVYLLQSVVSFSFTYVNLHTHSMAAISFSLSILTHPSLLGFLPFWLYFLISFWTDVTPPPPPKCTMLPFWLSPFLVIWICQFWKHDSVFSVVFCLYCCVPKLPLSQHRFRCPETACNGAFPLTLFGSACSAHLYSLQMSVFSTWAGSS